MVATPIGNLEDLSSRALRVLSEVSCLLTEDTRVTRKLCARHGIDTPLTSYHAHTKPARRAALLDRLAEGDLALVSDAGTPGLSDPGATLVAEAASRGHAVVPVPGPSAVATALSASGLPGAPHLFLGFLPRRGSERRRTLAEVAALPWTIVLFEAPHRLRFTLADLHTVLGDRPLVIGRELTKRHEEIWRGCVSDAIVRWQKEKPRGELTLVLAGARAEPIEPWDDARMVAALERLRAQGLGAREASRRLSGEAGRPAREIYRLWHESDAQDDSDPPPPIHPTPTSRTPDEETRDV